MFGDDLENFTQINHIRHVLIGLAAINGTAVLFNEISYDAFTDGINLLLCAIR